MGCHLLRHYLPMILMLLVFCAESTALLPYSNGYIKFRLPRAKGKPYIGKSCVFEPSFKHRSQYSHCDTYEGLVTVDDTIASSSVFYIIMPNKSNRHIKIHRNQTMGRLHSCGDGKICTIHEIVSFDRNPREGRDNMFTQTPQREISTMSPQGMLK